MADRDRPLGRSSFFVRPRSLLTVSRDKAAGGQILKNSLWNLLGIGLPLAVALVATPTLIARLGTVRFGLLALAWVLIGYVSVFDLGIGRALTQLVAARVASGRGEEIAGIIWNSLILTLLLGLLGAIIVAIASPWLVQSILRVPADLEAETVAAFQVLGLSIPAVTITAALRGVLEARQRFGLVNAARIPVGVLQYLGPLLALPFTRNLAVLVGILALVRVGALLVHIVMGLRAVPSIRTRAGFERRVAGRLLRFGGWMTVSSLISPLMVYADRFMVGALVSVGAVAYYAVPGELTARLLFLPLAIAGVLFPTFASGLINDRRRMQRLYRSSLTYLFLLLAPIVIVTMVLAEPGLRIWLGPAFADRSALVLQVLAIGGLFNGVAQAPFALIQGAGRPDITAKLHLAELPIYLIAAVALIRLDGITGAAVAWTGRMIVDALLLLLVAQRVIWRAPRTA